MPTMLDQTSNKHIGAGFAFPLQVNAQGSLQLSSGAPNLEESIWIVLKTQLGERVYRPTFGSRLADLAFEPLSIQTLLNIRLCVEEALQMWEPRLTLKEVRTEPDPIRGKVNIEIIYQPNDSYTIRSMVYPFYLLSAGD